jgi:glutamine amidotransferase
MPVKPNDELKPVAVVDYGMGNLFSVKHACEYAGMQAVITTDPRVILAAPAVILPGVGAFQNAMQNLRKNDLVSALRDFAATGRPFVGICLGLQLLMTESHEFGRHPGLGLIDGDVVRLDSTMGAVAPKVPHIGWSAIYSKDSAMDVPVLSWKNSFLAPVSNGSYMYFVHSYYARPSDDSVVLARTRFGSLEFCSSFSKNNIFACQFHPERSGPEGLKIYQALARAAAGDRSGVIV